MEEGLHVNVKNTKMKHVKRVGMLVGVYVTFSSKEWCQQDIVSTMKEDENNLEIRIENVH